MQEKFSRLARQHSPAFNFGASGAATQLIGDPHVQQSGTRT
jgi:hypothetical protein